MIVTIICPALLYSDIFFVFRSLIHVQVNDACSDHCCVLRSLLILHIWNTACCVFWSLLCIQFTEHIVCFWSLLCVETSGVCSGTLCACAQVTEMCSAHCCTCAQVTVTYSGHWSFLKVPKSAHITPFLCDLHWLPISSRI